MVNKRAHSRAAGKLHAGVQNIVEAGAELFNPEYNTSGTAA
ncbi:hypothetical protein RGAI101_1554 [Roseobacter sp. GAI101]|nr:hypothetical protein RGAI101_1554 [Roseobacter sp. GAI101]